MGKFETKFESAKQDWETPQYLFDYLNSIFRFTLDVAADEKNAKCKNFIRKEDDAMKTEWYGVCWLNPPYKADGYELKNWVKRAYVQSRKPDCDVVMLVPARTNTNWWHDYCMKASKIIFVRGRLKFGKAKYGLPQPLVIVYFGKEDNLIIESLDTRTFFVKAAGDRGR